LAIIHRGEKMKKPPKSQTVGNPRWRFSLLLRQLLLGPAAAVMRRLVGGLLESRGNTSVASEIAKAFDGKGRIAVAQARLRDQNARGAIGEDTICRYLGQGNPESRTAAKEHALICLNIVAILRS
jgi:hypothetical protein